MDNKMKQELIEKAKAAKNAEEIKTIAKENGMDMTDEEAKAYFEQFHKTGELSDEELGSVAGGGCHAKDGRLVVSLGIIACDKNDKLWRCKCGRNRNQTMLNPYGGGIVCRCGNDLDGSCGTCIFCVYEKGLWLCNRDEMRG